MNKLQEVVQRFRSGSTDSDKAPFNLDMDESRARSFSTNEADVRNDSSPAPSRKSDLDALKLALSRTAALQAQQLHSSVVSTNTETTSVPGEKKVHKKQPTGTFEYTVKEGDTLVKIGAQFDVTPSELIKTNKLLSRTVFVGQKLFIPNQHYESSNTSTPKSTSPVPNPVAQLDSSLNTLNPAPSQTAQATIILDPKLLIMTDSQPQQQTNAVDESDKESLQKFLKMPVRRMLEQEERVAESQGSTVRGTLLVTPVAIMFDPDVCDPHVISSDDQQKFSVVVYMEEVKSVALFHDISPRMFWRQPKDLRARSPKPEPYRSDQDKRSKIVSHCDQIDPTYTNSTKDGSSSQEGNSKQSGGSIDEEDEVEESRETTPATGRASEELQKMGDIYVHVADSTTEQSRLSEEVEHALSSSQEHIPSSPMLEQMSRGSEPEVYEIYQQQQDAATIFGESRDFGSHMGRSSSDVRIQMIGAPGRISESSPAANTGRLLFIDRTDCVCDDPSTPTQGFEPVHFTDRSPNSVTNHPKAVSGQRVLVLSQSPITCTDVDEDIKTGEICASELINPNQFESVGSESDTYPAMNTHSNSDIITNENPSFQHQIKSSDAKTKSQIPLSSNIVDIPHINQDISSESIGKNISDHNSSWTEKAHTVVDKLAFQVSNLTWDSVADQKDSSSKPTDGSTLTSFSPLRTPAHHISSFFNYTSSFFRGTGATEMNTSPLVPSTTFDSRSKPLPFTSPHNRLHLKSEFTKEDISRALGPDPKGFLLRSDSHHFKDCPMYLQIRRGIRKNIEIYQPRAFDHWNTSPMLNEYWFVVPRDMAEKLYIFLMTWQPDAYGDEEETEPRGKFFYDTRSVVSLDKNSAKTGDELQEDLLVSEDHFRETEKTWEILSKEEVYGAEKEQTIYRQDTIDECNIPDLIGPTVIIKQEHLRAILWSLPRNMSVGYNWELVYATHKHGYSLQNLYMRTESVEFDSPVLLFIMDTHDSIFGAYLSNTMRPNDTFYGSGATFLFTFHPEFKKFPWCGDNQFFMHGTKDFFAVGSGEGFFGLWLDGALDKGRSHPCPTFLNDVLAKEEDFNILQLEVWRFVDSSLC